jgi:hypothetical protein
MTGNRIVSEMRSESSIIGSSSSIVQMSINN